MDIQLVLGPNNSGKSLFAENLAMDTAEKQAAEYLYYLATMVPQTEENHQRIEKHKIQRKNKGFTTIEIPWDIHSLNLSSNSIVLLEDASNLLANGMFMHQSDVMECYKRICVLAQGCMQLIIVSISGLSRGDYDLQTNQYIEELNQLNFMLKNIANISFEM